MHQKEVLLNFLKNKIASHYPNVKVHDLNITKLQNKNIIVLDFKSKRFSELLYNNAKKEYQDQFKDIIRAIFHQWNITREQFNTTGDIKLVLTKPILKT